jgi:dolichol-phosphate mannosyltransferase
MSQPESTGAMGSAAGRHGSGAGGQRAEDQPVANQPPAAAASPSRRLVVQPVVVVPTYNERENLPEIVATVLALPVPGLRLLVVDDNSPDGTGRLADELAASAAGRVGVLHRPGKGGLGPAYLAGFERALAEGADAVIEMDADFSHDPAVIPALLARLAECDLVVGSRYIRGGGVDPAWSLPRRLLSRFGGLYARIILGLPIHDPTSGFRAYSRRALEAIDLTSVHSNGYTFQIEMAYAVHRQGLRLCEVPIHFKERARGQSKMSAGIAAEAAWRVWQLRLRRSAGSRQ